MKSLPEEESYSSMKIEDAWTSKHWQSVVTLTLGLQGCEPKKKLGSHLTCSQECKKCGGMNPHTPKWTPIVGIWSPKWIPKPSEGNWKGQTPLVWRIIYIIGKLLRLECLKWAYMTHLNIWNTSYGQMKGWESNWQFDSHSLKVRNWPDFLVCKWHVT
jgi:hypothetical protein